MKLCELSWAKYEGEKETTSRWRTKSKRKTSCSKSCSETVCCEHASKDIIAFKESDKNTSKKKRAQQEEWNYFSLRRTCFRGMSAYYKGKFDPYVKNTGKFRSTDKSIGMDQLVSNFITEEFGKSTDYCDTIGSNSFLDSVVTVLHSHRHKKNEDFIRSRDFSKIRKVLYSFSTAAKKTFLSNKTYALIFAHFYEKAGKKFVERKAASKPQQFKEELLVEFDSLYHLAKKTLTE